MTATRRTALAVLTLACGTLNLSSARAQEIETRNGVRYQVTRQVQQVREPTTVMQSQQQTVYAPQLTTNTVTHQQLYCVPNTTYQWNTTLRGRWNPFVTPYWTYDLRPVTTWSTQVANVQIPTNQVAWVPQTQTVQVPVTAYRTVEKEVITRVALNDSPNPGLAGAQPLSSGPTATIAARPSNSTSLGGVQMVNDPPREGTGGWQSPSSLGSRY